MNYAIINKLVKTVIAQFIPLNNVPVNVQPAADNCYHSFL